MNKFDKIKEEIMRDPSNSHYTLKGISPLFKGGNQAKIVIIGQAPGRRAQDSQMVWNDLSGERLREWMGVSKKEFYESPYLAHLPMDFYYPGKGKSGDAPPRKGFAEKWHKKILDEMPDSNCILLIGAYAQKFYLKEKRKKNLTETVFSFREYLPDYFPLVHPSPLNYGWVNKNPWFEKEVLPVLQEIVKFNIR